MKICLVTEYFYPDNTGGTPTGLSELARYLKDNHQDIEIDVVTSRNYYRLTGDKLPPFEDWDGVRIHRVGCPRSNRPSTMLRLMAGCCFTLAAFRKMLSLGKYDLVFVGTNPPSAPAAALAYKKRRGTPYLYLIHDLYPDIAAALGAISNSGTPAKIGRGYQKKWLHGASKVAVLGRCMKRHLERVYDLPEDRGEVITNWADPQQIVPMPKETEFRRKHGLSGFIALYAGNLGPFQGLDVVIDAAKIAGERGSDVTFLMVGKGARQDEIQARIGSEQIANLKLLPAVGADEYPEVLASSDVCLVPLAPGIDGLAVPSKFYTILAAARPTIAVLKPDSEVSQVVTELECGVQVNQGDPARLADAVIRIRDSADLAKRLGDNARQALESRYTLAHVADQYCRVFDEILGGRGALV